jgi:hypothetical protein
METGRRRRRQRGESEVEEAAQDSAPQAVPEQSVLDVDGGMVALKKCSLQVFVKAIGVNFFKGGLAVLPEATVWNTPDGDHYSRIRRDLAHGLLGVTSAPFFVSQRCQRPVFELHLAEFPLAQFAESLCHVAIGYVTAERSDPLQIDLVRNCIALATRLFPVREFQVALRSVSPALLARPFIEEGVDLFAISSSLNFEAVSLFYMAIIAQPDFLREIEPHSNAIFARLLTLGQITHDKRGFCYLHSILIAIALLLSENPRIAAQLNEQAPDPAIGSYGDMLLTVLMNISQDKVFWPSLAVVFRMLAPHVTTFSRATADRVMGLVALLWKKRKMLVPLFLEAFVENLDATRRPFNHFLSAIISNTELIDSIDLTDSKSAQAMPVLNDYLDFADEVMRENRIDKLTQQELLELLDEVQFAEEAPAPIKQPHTFEGEMEKTWGEWADLLFVRCFKDEIAKMREFQAKRTTAGPPQAPEPTESS